MLNKVGFLSIKWGLVGPDEFGEFGIKLIVDVVAVAFAEMLA
jgi:hypothetical protein